MATSSKRKRKPGKVYDFPEIDKLELKDALKSKLSLPELVALEKLIRNAVETERENVLNAAVGGAMAINYRVMRDRFGWGQQRIKRHWDICMSYWEDVNEGRVKLSEMIKLLETEDRIRIHTNARFLERAGSDGV